MKILSNVEFEKLTKDQPNRIKAMAKARCDTNPKGFVTIDDLTGMIQACVYSGDDRGTRWLKSLKVMATSGKLKKFRQGFTSREDHFLLVSELHRKGEIAFGLFDHIMLKDTGKRGTVVDYNPDTKQFAVTLDPFQLKFYDKKDLEKVARKLTAQDNSEWATEEAERWLLNDEGLYTEALRLGNRFYNAADLAGQLEELFRMVGPEAIYMEAADFESIDWYTLAESVLEWEDFED